MNAKMSALINNLKEVFNGKPWFGNSVMTVMGDIPFDKVHLKPVAELHSIIELTEHIIAWRVFVIKKIQGDKDYFVKLNSKDDWGDNRAVNETEWKSVLQRLEDSQNELLQLLEGKSGDFLSTIVLTKSNTDFNFEFFLNGLIHHDIYHLGQIAMVKKLVNIKNAAFWL
jgi:uncharacterized damage-inducible protein DinB